MNESRHFNKAMRIEHSLQSLDVEHFEAVIEGTMLAGTHWFNILLHRANIVGENADAMHAEFLSVGARRKIAVLLAEPLAALDEIEALRTTHVRGDMPDGAGAARRALACLAVLRGQALAGARAEPPG